MQRKCYFVCFLVFFLVACTGRIDTGPGLADVSSRFSEAMRWRDFTGAGNYLQEDVRGEFLVLFQADDDLHVVESRIFSVELDPDAQTAVADYRMEYYRLPSMRVKKWRWLQQWQLEQKNVIKSGAWLIINSPPPVP